MRILICDDDALIVEQLQKYIRKFFENSKLICPEITCFSDGESVLADKREKDILFLDVEMPGMKGIYVGSELKKLYPDIIIFIVTSYNEYLDDAMRFHVFRYLSKPIDEKRLYRNMKDAIDLYSHITLKLPIETKQGITTVPASSIIAVEAAGRKITVHTTMGDFESIRSMQHWADLLPKNAFFQTHRSFIVSAKYWGVHINLPRIY